MTVSSHSPEDVTNGLMLLSLRESLDNSVPLPSPSSFPPQSSIRKTTPYPPSSPPPPLPQVYQVPQQRQVLSTVGPSHLTSPLIIPPLLTSTASPRKVLAHFHKENYKPYSRQCACCRDPKTRMRLKVAQMF